MTRHGQLKHQPHRPGQDGFTILELMMAMFVFAIILASVAAALATTLNATRNNGNRVIAANIAATDIEDLRQTAALEFDAISAAVNPNVNESRTVGGVEYTLNRSMTWITGGAGTSACDGSSTAGVAYVRVTSSVSWPNMGGVKPPVSQTVLTPPVGVYKADTGNVGVKIIDQGGNPQSGVDVTLTGGTTPDTQTTGADGCVFFPFLTPGSFTVQIAKTGYADSQGVTSPSESAAVVAGTTTQKQFEYEQLGQINATLQGVYDNTPTYSGHVPIDVPLTLYNTIFQPTELKAFTGTGNPRVFSSMWPSDDGFPMWAGSCADADPDTWGTSLRPAAVPVDPGATTNAFVNLATQPLEVKLPSTGPLTGAAIRLVHAAGPGCSTGETLTYDASAVTDSNGEILIAAPFGTWKVEVVGHDPRYGAGTEPVITLDPNDSLPRAEVDVEVLP